MSLTTLHGAMPWLALLGLALTGPAQAGTPRALLVAVGDYQEETGWADLHSSHDLVLVQQALEHRGFAPEDIHLLRDAQATRQGILDAIRTHLLEPAGPGDHVLFHYSGHGQQITDDDGDEADGYDEALVPVDAPARAAGGYDGARHLRDDDLGDALDAVRARVGPAGSVTVVLDACHSGTATRSELPTRGGQPAMGPPAATGRGEDGVGSGYIAAAGGAALAPQVVLSAARANQVARETFGPDGQPVGALSLALSEVLLGDEPLDTWRAIYDRVRGTMSRTVRGQAPQLEGDADRIIFDGRFAEVPTYFSVAGSVGPEELRLAGGQLAGLTVGSTVELHKAGTSEPSDRTRLARGTVKATTATTANLTLDPADVGAAVEDLVASRVFVTAYGPGSHQLRVRLELEGPRRAAWQAAFDAQPLLVADDAAPHLVLRAASGQEQLVDVADLDAPLASGPASGSPAAGAVHAALVQRARTRLVQAISLEGARHKVAVTVVPADYDGDGGCSSRQESAATGGGEVILRPGDYFRLRIDNQGTATSYIAVAYIGVEGAAVQLLPPRGETPDQLPPGASFETTCFAVSPPYGPEQLKVFATRNPVDLGPVLGYAPVATRGEAPPLQQLLDQAGTGTRGLTPVATLDDGYSAEVVYTIAE